MFKGMRCEIQIQTILNHAWSETSHDIAYKHKPSDGFGTKAMELITQRLNRIMDKYLLPAGYEFQRVQHDYERLQQGTALFDEGILPSLAAAADNNELYERLASLKDQALPNYDDIPAIFRDLIEPLVTAVERARQTPKQPLKTTFGDLEGKDAADVTRLVVEIFDMLRYVDAKQTFEALSRIFLGEKDERIRKQILDAICHLSKYDLSVWNQVGPALQSVLIDAVAELTPERRAELEPLVLCVLEAALSSEISGTTWKANSVTLSSGAIPTTAEIKAIRDKAIRLLFDMFKQSGSEEQRRHVFHALREAARSSSRAAPSNDLYKQTLIDTARIADFLAADADALSFELRETIEHDFLFDYHRARDLAEADKFGCKAEATNLMKSILAFRDRINANRDYVRYKTLVGFETVLPEHWDDEHRDFEKVDEFRVAESQRFIDDINPANEAVWFSFIERCAATKSNDFATFPIYEKFLNRLAESKPKVARRLLDRGNGDVAQFIAAFLNGFYVSDRAAWRTYIDRYVAGGINLSGIMQHWRLSKPKEPEVAASVLRKAIEIEDASVVAQSVVVAIENSDSGVVPPKDKFFKPAIEYLTEKQDARWARNAWFAAKDTNFFDTLASNEAGLILKNLLCVPRIEYQAERILIQIARKHAAAVWEFFGQRLQKRTRRDDDDDVHYEAIPFKFHGLEKELSRDPKAAVEIVRGWYAESNVLFRFFGGRLLSAAFPAFQKEISDVLCDLIKTGSSDDADFILAVMENYHGEPATHEVLKCIVDKYPNDRSKLSSVRVSFDSTGVVSGEFGFANAMRNKKSAMEAWLSDERETVRTFAQLHMQELDLGIADEQRRAESRKAFRELDYEPDEDQETKDDGEKSDDDDE